VREFSRIDILVNNAASQPTYENPEDIPDEEWSYTFRTNIEAIFHLVKAAVPHMRPGSSIINTTSIQSDKPSPMLLAYASTKGAVSNFTAGLAQMLGSRGIRVNAVAVLLIWKGSVYLLELRRESLLLRECVNRVSLTAEPGSRHSAGIQTSQRFARVSLTAARHDF